MQKSRRRYQNKGARLVRLMMTGFIRFGEPGTNSRYWIPIDLRIQLPEPLIPAQALKNRCHQPKKHRIKPMLAPLQPK